AAHARPAARARSARLLAFSRQQRLDGVGAESHHEHGDESWKHVQLGNLIARAGHEAEHGNQEGRPQLEDLDRAAFAEPRLIARRSNLYIGGELSRLLALASHDIPMLVDEGRLDAEPAVMTARDDV